MSGTANTVVSFKAVLENYEGELAKERGIKDGVNVYSYIDDKINPGLVATASISEARVPVDMLPYPMHHHDLNCSEGADLVIVSNLVIMLHGPGLPYLYSFHATDESSVFR